MRTIAGAIVILAGAHIMAPEITDQFRFIVGVIIILMGVTVMVAGLRTREA